MSKKRLISARRINFTKNSLERTVDVVTVGGNGDIAHLVAHGHIAVEGDVIGPVERAHLVQVAGDDSADTAAVSGAVPFGFALAMPSNSGTTAKISASKSAILTTFMTPALPIREMRNTAPRKNW